jgi:spermidine/putrescine transport system substrate-binding protein
MQRYSKSRYIRFFQGALQQLAVQTGIILFWTTLFLGILWGASCWDAELPSRTINVFTWTELIDRRMVERFEKATGIKVNIGYFESNEELYAKLKITKGAGYDLVVPTDYLVQTLVNDQMLKKIDRSKLNFFDRLDQRLIGQYFDPHNDYSVPYLWSLYGIGINKNFFETSPTASWKLLLDPHVTQIQRLMTEDARELALIASFALYGTIDGINAQKMGVITNLLLEQKPFVMAYTDYTAAYLLGSGSVGMALATSPYVVRAAQESPDIDFLLPEEGTFALIESFVIPATSTKEDLVYQFLNFMYQQNIVAHHVAQTYFFPAVTDVACADMPGRSKELLEKCARTYTKFQFFQNTVSERRVNDLWLALKSA